MHSPMEISTRPFVQEYKKIGSSALGYITPIEGLPFDIKRVYWTYYSPHEVIRGHHSHKRLHELIFAVSGVIEFKLESPDREVMRFTLDKPHAGLYIPPPYWRTLQFSHNAILLSITSAEYEEDEYIRDYETFLTYYK